MFYKHRLNKVFILCQPKLTDTSAELSAWSQLDTFLGVEFGVWSAVWSHRRLRLGAAAWDAAEPLTAFRSPDFAFSAICSLISLCTEEREAAVLRKHLTTFLSFAYRSMTKVKDITKVFYTSSLERCCSFITSMYDLAGILGSGVLPPVQKSSNKMQDSQPGTCYHHHVLTLQTVNWPSFYSTEIFTYYVLSHNRLHHKTA